MTARCRPVLARRSRSRSSDIAASDLLGPLLIGAASGLRSQAGVAAVLLSGRSEGLPPQLGAPPAKIVAGAAAGGELVVDKLPGTKSRLRPASLVVRALLGGLSAGQLARRKQRGPVPAAVVGALAALVFAKGGHDVRARLANRFGDRKVAVVEDLIAAGLAAGAISLSD
ncbi:MAG: hypothetical protein JWM85_2050 [Acidimicrobiaceae bacterium]|nr:hypothetical protein [Acidimicrobiaceae bacterium]